METVYWYAWRAILNLNSWISRFNIALGRIGLWCLKHHILTSDEKEGLDD
jgi:hypothetical protein